MEFQGGFGGKSPLAKQAPALQDSSRTESNAVPAVGILAARLAQIRGAQQVIVIDREDYRLKYAQKMVSNTFQSILDHEQPEAYTAQKPSLLQGLAKFFLFFPC